MRTRLVVLGIASLLTACGASSAHSSSAAGTLCGPKEGRTLAASALARVYALHGSVYGCSAHGGSSYKLGGRATCIGSSRVAPVRVSGELAAYGLERCGVDTGSTAVTVRRLTDGKQLLSTPAASSPGPEAYQSIASLVLKADGAVAWIGVGSSLGTRHRVIEVRKSDRQGSRLLDSGATIRTGSMRLRGSTVRWKHGDQTRSATLH